MSLINDALKRAQQNPPADAHPPTQQPLLPLQPVAHNPVPVAGWLIPAVVIFLIVAAIFFVGWAMANRSVSAKIVASVPPPVAAPPPVAPAPVAVAAPPVITPAAVVPEPPPVVAVEAPPLPVLQGVFYSPTAPTAIVSGKSVRPGDTYKQYRVKEITKSAVILVDAEGQLTKLVMGN